MLLRQEQHKPKGSSARRRKNKRRKKPIRPRNGNGRIKKNLWWKRNRDKGTLEVEVLVYIDYGSIPFGIFQTVTGMTDFLEIIVTETSIYATQKVRKFKKTENEMKALLRIKFVMGMNKLQFERPLVNRQMHQKWKDKKNKISVHLTESSFFQ